MNISIYYREAATISLNESIAALVPAGMIIAGNLLFFDRPEIMLLAIPFFMFSFVCFHFYLFRMKQSFSTGKKLINTEQNNRYSLFGVSHLFVFFHHANLPELHFYFPNGVFAGKIKRRHNKGMSLFWEGKAFALFNQHGQEVGSYKVRGKTVEVYDKKGDYIGYFANGKNSKQLFDIEGKSIWTIEGSNLFMDEKVFTKHQKQAARLRRGWMRAQWLDVFPNPNTPVLSFSESLPEKDKLLTMSLLIQEFFIDR